MEVSEYLDGRGRSPFRTWFETLDRLAAAKVHAALVRLRLGNTSNVKSVGGGLYEYRIDFGPGYRIYFGYQDRQWVILLGGGSKARQDKDIKLAQSRWADHGMRKESASWH